MKKDFNYKDVPQTYPHCLHAQCPQAQKCLRFYVAQHADEETQTFPLINPNYLNGKEESCPYFQLNVLTRFASGITHLFDDLPHAKAVKIKQIIYNYFKRNMYYRILNKERLIKLDEEAFIRGVFKKEGIDTEPVFDEYVYKYDW
ncbi:DUF6078 family protein [Bacteroides sp. 519]|uniref:DUF6078 family protein n=1 Tax=Bacteroides sp. 519 TaxID=2302937 RepID=UPI0013D600C3|nr:DUF6078 family protein [Bacteroides sp. 519]NDV58237.1 hypothetical protein [Bacteroides sp. 519]